VSAVGAVSSSGAVAVPGARPTQLTASGEGPSLLPDPAAGALAGADPLSMLYLFESTDERLGAEAGASQIQALQGERHQALQQEQQAIQQAIDAQKNHSFWDDLGSICSEVGKVAAVIASVAAAVATLGAATPIAALAIAGAVLSTASFADGELHVLRSLGVDEKTAGLVDMTMSLSGAALSCGSGLWAGGRVASSTLSILSRTSVAVAGIGQVGRAASGIAAGQAQAQGDQAAADQIAAQARSEHALRLTQLGIDRTASSDQESRRIEATIANTISIRNETTEAAAAALRG
jgi:hypothetical protein